MKIWFDTEFIEDGKTIDLMSIGMVREDGETLYLESRECNLDRASPWVKHNVIPHRSRECKCINSNKEDFKRYTEADIAGIEALEADIGRNMFRPHRHMGAQGIREVIRWAHSDRGKYEKPEKQEACNAAWCES